jgi:hypothetical protein
LVGKEKVNKYIFLEDLAGVILKKIDKLLEGFMGQYK